MIKKIYGRALTVLARKPFRLWGLSLLSALLGSLAGTLCGVVPLLNIALVALLSVGMTMVFLHGYLGEEVRTENLFDGFRGWNTIGRLLGGMGMMYLKVFLWGLIPIAGIVIAIVKSYAYRLTPYILMMEPEVPASKAYKVSEGRTMGFKGKMFWADLLWFLAVLVVMGILALLGLIPIVGILFWIVFALVALVLILFGELFSGLIQAAFYVEIQRSTGIGPQFDDSQNDFEPRKEIGPSGKRCPVCGALNVTEARFCSGCGYNFSAAAPAEEPAPEPEAPAEEPTAPETPAEEENKAE